MNVFVLLLGLIAIGGAVTLALYAVGALQTGDEGVRRSLQAIESYGMSAPYHGVEATQPSSFKTRIVDPLLARALVLGRRLTPAENATRVRHQLDVAGNPSGWTVDRVIAFKVVGFVVGLGGSLFLTTVMGLSLFPRVVVCVGVAMLGYVGVNLWLYNTGEKRTLQMRKDLPDAIDLLTISVEAGLGFDAAMAQVARNTEGPVSAEFARLLQEMQIGMARGQAMRALGDRTALPELRSFANAVAQADAFGIPVGKVLRVQSQEMRIKRRQLAEEKAQKVAVKILFPLMFCILPTLFIVVMGPVVVNYLTRRGS
jgi:tight adherence protein C